MTIKFETVVAGEMLLDVHSYRMGNTKMRATGVWPVRVISVDHAKRTAVVSWNGNREKILFGNQVTKLYRVAPEWIQSGRDGGGRSCHYCRGREAEGHTPTCTHPKAERARKKGIR